MDWWCARSHHVLNSDAKRRAGAAARIAAVTTLGHVLGYAMSIAVARTVTPATFEEYVVATATFLVLMHVSRLGFDKYAVRIIPAAAAMLDSGRIQAFMRFAGVRVALMSWATAVVAVGYAWWRGDSGLVWAMAGAGLVLSTAARAHVLAGVLAGCGDAVTGAAALRTMVPAVALGAFALVSRFTVPAAAATPILCWGLGWVAARYLLERRLLRRFRMEPTPADPDAAWVRLARPYWMHAMVASFASQAGILLLDLQGAGGATVGGFAAASATAGTVTAIVASTNPVYASRLALSFDRGDADAARRLRRVRVLWALPLSCVASLLLWMFANTIVGWYHPEFVAEGAPALRILALALPVSLTLGLTPFELKLRGYNSRIAVLMMSGAVAQVAFLLVLAPRFGAAGAAAAYVAASTLMFVGAAWSIRGSTAAG